MPIKRLQDREARPALPPMIGRLYKGSPQHQNEKGKMVMGRDLEYFRFESDYPEVKAAFDTLYGAEPRVLRVRLPFATVDKNFDCWQEAREGTGHLMHRCDGETCTLWRGDDGKMHR